MPSEALWNVRVEQTGQNLSLSVLYMKYKLLTSALLEAVVELTGGDGPIALFLGQMTGNTCRIELYLPKCDKVPCLEASVSFMQLQE